MKKHKLLFLSSFVLFLIYLSFFCSQEQRPPSGEDPTAAGDSSQSGVIVTDNLDLDFSKHKVTFIELGADRCMTRKGRKYCAWFQLYELEKIGTSFGLTPQEVRSAVARMAEGAAMTMYECDLVPDEVMDLIPVKPLEEQEENIKRMYLAELKALFNKLKS